MLLAILGDAHIGIRGDDLNFHDYYKKFYDFLFPILEKENIKTVIQTGDIFDRRKYTNINSLYLCDEYFFGRLSDSNIDLHSPLGNHDIYFRDSLRVNSPSMLLRGYKNVFIYDDFTTEKFDNLNIDFVPWICSDNKETILSNIKTSKSKVCIGHFEINGFEFYRGIPHLNGDYDSKLFKHYDLVISGHFHTKSNKGNIHYVGTPYQLTWADYDDPRGFHIFDTETLELKFIENPYTIFKKIEYDDVNQTMDFWNKEFNYNELSNCLVKLIVQNKKNPFIFDSVIDKIQKTGVIKLNIIDNQNLIEINNLDDSNVNVADTLTLLNNSIDEIDVDFDKIELRKTLSDLYAEALNTGATD